MGRIWAQGKRSGKMEVDSWQVLRRWGQRQGSSDISRCSLLWNFYKIWIVFKWRKISSHSVHSQAWTEYRLWWRLCQGKARNSLSVECLYILYIDHLRFISVVFNECPDNLWLCTRDIYFAEYLCSTWWFFIVCVLGIFERFRLERHAWRQSL